MKRRRKLIAYRAETSNTDEHIRRSGPSISDLPTPIVVDILLKVSGKGIIMCKSMCKTWFNLISNRQFADMHFAQSMAFAWFEPWKRPAFQEPFIWLILKMSAVSILVTALVRFYRMILVGSNIALVTKV